MNLSEIKDIRRSLGLTQSELAKMAGISQATIARIEAGNVDPAFANAQRVFSALDKVKKTQLPKHVSLQDIMSRKVIYIESTANLRKAAIIMKRKNISQMPVIEKGAIVGSITEADISHAVFSRNPEKLSVKDRCRASRLLACAAYNQERLCDKHHYPRGHAEDNQEIDFY